MPFARELLGVADIDTKFCIKKLALLDEKLHTVQCCVSCEAVLQAFLAFPTYSLKVIPERSELEVADRGFNFVGCMVSAA